MEADEERFASLIEDLQALQQNKALLTGYHVTIMHRGYENYVELEVSFNLIVPPGVKTNIAREQKAIGS